jgi:hypothetical protein
VLYLQRMRMVKMFTMTPAFYDLVMKNLDQYAIQNPNAIMARVASEEICGIPPVPCENHGRIRIIIEYPNGIWDGHTCVCHFGFERGFKGILNSVEI